MRLSYLTLVGLIACRDKPPEPPPPAPPHDGVTLIQPGVPPLQTLRYHLTKGSVTTSRLECDVDMKSGEQREAMPTQIVDLETTVEDVLGNGAARLRIAVIGASARARPGGTASELIQAQAAALRGVVITETLGPDGVVSDAHLEAGASDKLHRELDSLVRSLEYAATRLPAEPVGAGATWRERRTLPEGGIRAVSEITYTLASLAGGAVSYTSFGESIGAAQTIEQDGAKVEVTDTHGRSEATGSIDLARYALDVTAMSTFATTMAVVAPDAGPGAERSTIEIAMAIRMTSAAPAAPPAGGDPAAAPGDPAASGDAGAGSGSAGEPLDHGAHSAP
jgi:hypothetical protein